MGNYKCTDNGCYRCNGSFSFVGSLSLMECLSTSVFLADGHLYWKRCQSAQKTSVGIYPMVGRLSCTDEEQICREQRTAKSWQVVLLSFFQSLVGTEEVSSLLK